jgi:excisionase family DNA binding protein
MNNTGKTDLYRFFDAKGTLLYVGISISAFSRLCQHRKESDWYDLAVRIDIEKYKTRKDAEQAEREAIYKENPIFNVSRVVPDEDNICPSPTSSKYSGNIGGNFLITKEAADYLGLKKSTLEAWRTRGGGPTFLKIGRAVRYRLSDLDLFANNSAHQHTSAYSLINMEE